LKLVIVHHHYRPGGVRRVIELAVPHLLRSLRPPISKVVLAGGEAPDAAWLALFSRALGAVPVELFIEPAVGYFSEQKAAPATISRQCRRAVKRLFAGDDGKNHLVWAHNLGLARNLLLTRELVCGCKARGILLVAHHHDWWFDNRWQRWPELRRAGCRTLGAAAQAVFAAAPNVRHAAINQADAAILQEHFGPQAGWLPNLAERNAPVVTARVRQAKRWLSDQLGDDAPVWLMPCRLLRRKNIAEALLLTRWLRPDAWLVTTGGVSSVDEKPYAQRMVRAARRHGWRLKLGVMQGDESAKPSVAELLAASEVVLLTSIQEGFGLPYLESTAARRPFIARRLPNIAPDLARFGFRFPQSYDELSVDSRLFDWEAEVKRQLRLFRGWHTQLPLACRRLAVEPALLAVRHAPQPVPFSRLTLRAQLEVLTQPADHSWELCAPLNAFLHSWRNRAERGLLRVTPWPRTAAQWLSGAAYARRFVELLHAGPNAKLTRQTSLDTQQHFLRLKLSTANLYPLLWSRTP
jgi:hypothetical protein